MVVRRLRDSSQKARPQWAQTIAPVATRSRIEFIAELGVVVEEIDESVYWLELLARRSVSQPDEVVPVLAEARELRAIFAKGLGTARTNLK
jgi:hypothetical protein